MKAFLLSVFTLLFTLGAQAQDPNFHIYLCLGQSNMEGNAQIEDIDRRGVSSRFRMMAAVKFSNPARNMYGWYTATPPLVRENTGLTPMDWFGRTMIDNLPKEVTVGVVPVAIGGCRIEHLYKNFDPATLADEADWFKGYMAAYDNQPYARLVECAKRAQKKGVIKGILLHQGCSNNGDEQWPTKVKKIYRDLLADLGLSADTVPLLAGEVVSSSMGGICGGMNTIIKKLPKTIPTAHVISSAKLPQKGDGLHFTAHGYRVLGCRYATCMLQLLGIENPVVNYSENEGEAAEDPKPNPSEGDYVFDFKNFKPTIWENGTWDATTQTFVAGQYGFGGWEFDDPIDLSGYKYIVAELSERQSNGASFRIFDNASYWAQPYSSEVGDKTLLVAELDGMMKPTDSGITTLNTAEIYRVGFWAYGGQPIKIKQVYATNTDPYAPMAVSAAGSADTASPIIYTLQGVAVGTDFSVLPAGIYVCGGRCVIKN